MVIRMVVGRGWFFRKEGRGMGMGMGREGIFGGFFFKRFRDWGLGTGGGGLGRWLWYGIVLGWVG